MPRFLLEAAINGDPVNGTGESAYVIVDIDAAAKSRFHQVKVHVDALVTLDRNFCDVRFWMSLGGPAHVFEDVGLINQLQARFNGVLSVGDLLDVVGWIVIPDEFTSANWPCNDEDLQVCFKETGVLWHGYVNNSPVWSQILPYDALWCPIHGPDEKLKGTCLMCVADLKEPSP